MTPVNIDEAYVLLGVTSAASEAEIVTRWKELRSLHHPDHGGDAENFIALKLAYTTALRACNQQPVCVVCNGTKKVRRVVGFSSIDFACSNCVCEIL